MTDQPDTFAGADQPLDAGDAALLDEMAAMYEVVDPMPEDLVERISFALALDEMFEEVAEMTRVPADSALVRSDTGTTGAVRTDTLTFSAERLTAMVTVSRAGGGRVRLDGWVSPLGRRQVDVRMQGVRHRVETDESGRFEVDDLREGFVQLVFHAPAGGPGAGPDDGDELVVTPLFKM